MKYLIGFLSNKVQEFELINVLSMEECVRFLCAIMGTSYKKYSWNSSIFLVFGTVSLFFMGCRGQEGVFESSAPVGQQIQCFSHTASLVALSDTQVDLVGNARLSGSVALFGLSSLLTSGNASVGGTVYSGDHLSSYEPGVWDLQRQIEHLEPTQTVDSVSSSVTFVGTGGLNVIAVRAGIHLSGTSEIVLEGTQYDQFIFLVESQGIELSGKSRVLVSGGVSARSVMFLVASGGDLSITGQASAVGTLFLVEGQGSIAGKGALLGAMVAKGRIKLAGNGVAITPSAWCPELSWARSVDNEESAGSGTVDEENGVDSGNGGTDSESGSGDAEGTAPTCTGLSCGVLGV